MTAEREGVGALAFERVGARSVITAIRARSPLRLLTPKNHGIGAWVFASNFGGGLVDGDALSLSVCVGDGCTALLGTQASTKVYRSPRGCSQSLTASVGDEALFVSLPDPVTCFAGARYAQDTRVALATERASLVLVEGMTAGRTAHDERWQFDAYRARTDVTLKGEPFVRDATRLERAHGDVGRRMGRFDALAALVLAGPRTRGLREHALSSREGLSRRADVLIAPSPIERDGLVVRVAGTSVERVAIAVRGLLAGLPGLLGDDPFQRKY